MEAPKRRAEGKKPLEVAEELAKGARIERSKRAAQYLERFNEAKGVLGDLERQMDELGQDKGAEDSDLRHRVLFETMADQERVMALTAKRLLDQYKGDLDDATVGELADVVARAESHKLQAKQEEARAKKKKGAPAPVELPELRAKDVDWGAVVEDALAERQAKAKSKKKEVPRPVELPEATASPVPMDDSHEEATMAGAPFAFEHPAPVELPPKKNARAEARQPDRAQELENEIQDLIEGTQVREGKDFREIRGLSDIEKELHRFGVDADQMMVSGWKRFTLGLRGVFQPRVTALMHEHRSMMKALKPKMDELESLRGSGVTKQGLKRRGARQKKVGEMASR